MLPRVSNISFCCSEKVQTEISEKNEKKKKEEEKNNIVRSLPDRVITQTRTNNSPREGNKAWRVTQT